MTNSGFVAHILKVERSGSQCFQDCNNGQSHRFLYRIDKNTPPGRAAGWGWVEP